MKKLIKKIKNYHPPKFVIYLFLGLIIVFNFLFKKYLDNDLWFLLKHGEYVLNNGFPTIEPFSMHENLTFVMQQWLSSCFFYLTYHWLGEIGLGILVAIIFLLIIIIIQKIGLLLTNNKFYLASLITIITSLLLTNFMVTRPQIFSYLIILLLIYNLELYIKTKKIKYLYYLPILSILEINLHASMWLMLFLFILTYLIDAFNFKISFLKGEGYGNIHFLIVLILMFLGGFLNPYGFKNVTYLLGSYNILEINIYIGEMQPVLITDLTGKLVFITIFLVLLTYIFFKKGKLKTRYLCLLLGTLYLTLSHYKGYPWFLIGSLIPLNYYLKDYFKNYNFHKKYSFKFKTIVILEYLIIIIFLFLISYNNQNTSFLKNQLVKSVNYLNNNYSKDLTIYTNYNDGSYLLYNNYKVYLDPRAEVYLKAKNKKEDIFKEYYKLQNQELDVKKFLDKYQFTLLFLDKNDYLYTYLQENLTNYQEVYHDEYRFIYQRDDLNKEKYVKKN